MTFPGAAEVIALRQSVRNNWNNEDTFISKPVALAIAVSVIFILLAILVLSLSLIKAQPYMGGGGGWIPMNCSDTPSICKGDYNICNQSTGNCILNDTSFTACLIKNCDDFCKSMGQDAGRYYKEDKCWCEKQMQTPKGTIAEKGGWIQISECHIIDSKDEAKSQVFGWIVWIIISAGIVFFIYSRINPEKKRKNKWGRK